MSVGVRFVKCGLGLFIFGVFIGFGPIGHYVIGANHPTGEAFLHNVSLWFACPWTLPWVGSLGMVALGLTQMQIARSLPGAAPSGSSSAAFLLCVVGLLGAFAVGYPGYFVFDNIWPSFYYMPVQAGKNAWLLGQALFIFIFLCGTVLMFNHERQALSAIAESTN